MRLTRSLAYRGAAVAGLHHVARSRHRGQLLIVMYHGVHAGAEPGDTWHFLPVRELERQLRYLRRQYAVLDLDAALSALYSGGLARPTAAITFDDGYLDNRALAFPLLERLQLPATIYLNTGLIGTDRRLWTFEVERCFLAASRPRPDLSEWGLDVPELGDDRERRRWARRLVGRWKRMGPEARAEAMHQLELRLEPGDGPPDPRSRMMGWEDVARMEKSGLVRFGAHTVDHEIVSRLTDPELERQVGGSIEAVRAHCARPSRTFAYPNGAAEDFDQRAAGVLRRHGIDWAVTTLEGLNADTTDPYELRRVTVANDTTMPEFKLRSSGFLGGLKRLVRP